MRKDLKKDVRLLALQSLLAEGSQKVWKQFEKALEQMDADSVYLLRQYFSGITVAVLSQKRKVTETQMNGWISQAKRELTQRMKNGYQVKH